MEIIGTIKRRTGIQTFASGFQKREFVIVTDEQYPQPINIELLGDKVDIIDFVPDGTKVKVGINIRGREWTNPQGEVKYFNSITAWKITRADGSENAPKNEAEPTEATPLPEGLKTAKNDTDPFAEDEEDDLPF